MKRQAFATLTRITREYARLKDDKLHRLSVCMYSGKFETFSLPAFQTDAKDSSDFELNLWNAAE